MDFQSTGSIYASSSPSGYVMVPTANSATNTSNIAPEAQLDALLDELQLEQQQHTAARNRLNPPDPPKRLPSYPSTESGGSPVRCNTLHPPLPPKPTKIPPLPPPRTSSKSPIISPSLMTVDSESSESLNSQDGGSSGGEKLNQRHQELLRKQKQLQDQYVRLQLIQEKNNTIKRNGSDGNISGKMMNNIRNVGVGVGVGVGGGGGDQVSNNLALSNETDIL